MEKVPNSNQEHRQFLEYKKLLGEPPISFSPNGERYISGNRLFDLITGVELFYIPASSLNVIAISYDGMTIIAGSNDGSVDVWNTTLPTLPAPPPDAGDVDWENKHQISPDGIYIVESGDNDLLIKNIKNGNIVTRISKQGTEITRFGFSDDGRYIVARGFDGTNPMVFFRLWKTEDLIADACSRVTRNLTHAEWSQYIGDALPYQAVCPNLPIETESMLVK
jgi:WD40 repeat protein